MARKYHSSLATIGFWAARVEGGLRWGSQLEPGWAVRKKISSAPDGHTLVCSLFAPDRHLRKPSIRGGFTLAPGFGGIASQLVSCSIVPGLHVAGRAWWRSMAHPTEAKKHRRIKGEVLCKMPFTSSLAPPSRSAISLQSIHTPDPWMKAGIRPEARELISGSGLFKS